MTDLNDSVFINLFREVCQKCFGHSLTESLSESDSKLLANNILEQTGLVIGVKTIKNYSQYVLNTRENKKENPSIATLDTLARYLLDAPYTDEIQRKKTESHHPYWFRYKSRFSSSPVQKKGMLPGKKMLTAFVIALGLIITVLMMLYFTGNSKQNHFADEFSSVNVDSLTTRGWVIKNIDSFYWSRSHESPGHLSLFTLRGDNWPDAKNVTGIRNLLIRKIDPDCFTAEIHLSAFVPGQNWQQAGILLSEDSTFSGKVLRLSLGYNNFFGGYVKPAEIIIQGVVSSQAGSLSKPEEIAHVSLFSLEPGKDSIIAENLSRSALKIEKKNNHYRLLYSVGRMEDFAFKEAVHGDYNIAPKYIGVFAMQGFAEKENPVPVLFDSFSITGIECDK